jgi:ketosteroid isomerase-like protein
MRESHRLVHEFFAAVRAGELPDAMLTEDMAGWTTLQGPMSKAAYQEAIRILARISREPLAFTIDSVTAEDDRVAAEVRSDGVLIDGTPYANTYVFVFRVRDGKIASVAEHFNALIVREKMIPLLHTPAARG